MTENWFREVYLIYDQSWLMLSEIERYLSIPIFSRNGTSPEMSKMWLEMPILRKKFNQSLIYLPITNSCLNITSRQFLVHQHIHNILKFPKSQHTPPHYAGHASAAPKLPFLIFFSRFLRFKDIFDILCHSFFFIYTWWAKIRCFTSRQILIFRKYHSKISNFCL